MMVDEHTGGSEREQVENLIYRVAHDLRASTRAIAELPTWIIEDLEEAGIELPQSPAQALDMLRIHALRLDEMIQGLVDLSRAGRSDKQAINLTDCVDLALQDVTLPEGSRLRVRCDPVNTIGNERDIITALAHMIVNAATHHPGTARIAVFSRQNAGWAEIWVRDDGPGIPEAQRQNVVKPLVKLRSRDDSPGPGMGLAIADKIARAHGGSLDIHDRPRGDPGTAVCLKIPCSEPQVRQARS